MTKYVTIPEGVQLTFDDVMQTLAANGGTGMTSADASTLFAEAANINWASKKKPVQIASYFPDRTTSWWKASDGLCGMRISAAVLTGSAKEALPSLADRIDGKMNQWVYNRPAGGAASPFRIADFEGYSTTAQLVTGYMVPTQVNNESDSRLQVSIAMPIESDAALTWADFTPIARFYFGAIMKRNDGYGSEMVVRTAEVPIAESTSVSLPTWGLPLTTFDVFPFLSSLPIRTEDEGLQQCTFYTIPNTSVVETTVVNYTPSLLIKASKANPFTVNVTLTVRNPDTKPRVMSNNSMRLRYPSSAEDSPMLADEMLMVIDNFTVPAGETVTVTAPPFEFVPSSLFNDCIVWVYINGGQVKAEIFPINIP